MTLSPASDTTIPMDSSTTTVPLAAATLSPLNKKTLRDWVRTLSKTNSQFCCGGVIKLPPDEKLALFYNGEDERQARRLTFPIEKNGEDVNDFISACSPSSHGQGDEAVFDPSYRLARELKRDQFALTMDILQDSDVLSIISRLAIAGMGLNEHRLVARLYKLNAYIKDGFFKIHRDTPKSQYHVGTLVVALPLSFKGGELRVIHRRQEVIFDWETEESTSDGLSLPWAFLFSDVEHEVLPVISGTRVTLAYDIFVKYPEANESFTPQLVAPSIWPLYSKVKAALEDPSFLPQGGKVAITLYHEYPIDKKHESPHYAMYLKGIDAVLYHIVSSLGIPVSRRIVYASEEYDGEYNSHEEDIARLMDDDNFAPASKRGGKRIILYTSMVFKYHRIDYQIEYGDRELYERNIGAKIEPELIWARKPSKDVWANSGQFIAYGNEPSLQNIYSAAALILDIPAFGEGPRCIGHE